MNHIIIPRKNSLSYRIVSGQQQREYNLSEIKSLNESPQSGSPFWLRRTQYYLNSHDKETQEKSIEKSQKNKGFVNKQKQNKEQIFSSPLIVKFKSIQKITSLSFQSALCLIQNSIKYCSLMHRTYGSSFFNINNYHLNQENQFIIYISNESLRYNLKFNSTSDQSMVVRDIIESVHKICPTKCFSDFYSYYKRNSIKNKCNFRYTLMLIQSYCQCSKILLGKKVQRSQEIQYQSNSKQSHQFVKSDQKKLSYLIRANDSIANKTSFSKNRIRESVQKKLFGTVNDESEKNKIIRNDIFSMKSKHKQFPSKNSIKNQYNILYNPKQEVTLLQKRNSQIKESTVSTNFKSSQHPGDYLQISTTNFLNRISGSLKYDKLNLSKSNEGKQYFSFLPSDLDQVQSLGQSSDYDQQSQLPTRRYQTPRDTQQEKSQKQNEERILTINNWTRKVNSLLGQQTDIKESFIDKNAKENKNDGSDPQYLVKMVRKTAQSILQVPSQFK